MGENELGTADVPADLRRTFWTLVALFNAALLGVGLGVLVIAFRGRWAAGGAAIAAGLAAFAVGYRRYRAERRNA